MTGQSLQKFQHTILPQISYQQIFPVSILYKSTAGHYQPVRVADRRITARCRFIKNASWAASIPSVLQCEKLNHLMYAHNKDSNQSVYPRSPIVFIVRMKK